MTAKPRSAPTFTVQKGVPIPPLARGGRGAACPYPFFDMVKGDSFFLPAADVRTQKLAMGSCSRWARSFAKRECKGFRIVLRRVDGGVRCWRLE